MGMGMMLWEWEGAGTLKLIPAHLYRGLYYRVAHLSCCIGDRTIVTSSGVGNLDDLEGGSVKHVRHYQVYRGMSPSTSSRLEVLYVDSSPGSFMHTLVAF